MDVARSAIRLGAKKYLWFIVGGKVDMTAMEEEIQGAIAEELNTRFIYSR